VDSSQVGILKETDEVSLSSFLKSEDSGGLETEVGLEVLSNLTDKALEGQLADQELSGLLVLANFTKSDSSGPVSVGLLDSASSRSGFASSCTQRRNCWERRNERGNKERSNTIVDATIYF
jgi:hypothetical protein